MMLAQMLFLLAGICEKMELITILHCKQTVIHRS